MRKLVFREGFVMKIIRSGGIATLATLMLSSGVQAQVTPEDVWQNWQAAGAASGQTLTAASESRVGDTLTVRDVAVNSAFDEGTLTGTIPEITFRDAGDGTVTVAMSPEYPLVLDTTSPEGERTKVAMTVRQPGLQIVSSGTPAETRYDFTAPSLQVTVEDVTVDDVAQQVDVVVDVTTLAGNYLFGAGGTEGVSSEVTAAGASLTMNVVDPETSATARIVANVSDIAGTSSGVFLGSAQPVDMAQALREGFTSQGDFTYGPATVEFDTAEGADTGTGTYTSGSGNIVFALDRDRMNYGGGVKDAVLTLSGTSIPVPELSARYAEAAFNLLIPVAQTEEPGNFAFLTRLVDLTISDEAWNLFDPGSVLPRDPATIIIDTTGTARWLVDMLSPDQPPASPEETPVELHSLDIANLTVRAVGAEVTGKGAFTFDNTDLTTFQGMPAPTGTMDLRIVGANALIDRLIQLGILPEDQAMGARMMMGLFARPGEGEDTLTSTLEFKDKGFYANGQRLQ
jgi:hypothetical protein